MSISNQQMQAVQRIADWYAHDTYNKPFFYLAGLAGSGKTYTAPYAVEACGIDPSRVMYGAYTGKAAMVMNQKGMPAQTLHSLCYKIDKNSSTAEKPVFRLNFDSELRDASLLVLDECSMVNEALARDIMHFNVPILVLGDPGQIKPIEGSGYFTEREPDFFLSEIHRQALESSIIRLAHDVRNRKPVRLGDYGDVVKLRLDDFDTEDFRLADQIITGTHNSRHMLNEHLLELNGYQFDIPTKPGIKLICKRNYREAGFYNGMIARTTRHADQIDRENRCFMQAISIEDGVGDLRETDLLLMNEGLFQDNWSPRTAVEKKLDQALTFGSKDETDVQMMFDFGYAITVHSAQGSQWNNTVLYDDGHLNWLPQDRATWLYTAITRAAEKLHWVVG